MAIVLSTKSKTVTVVVVCIFGASFAVFVGSSSRWFSKADPLVEPLTSMKREARLIGPRMQNSLEVFQVINFVQFKVNLSSDS